MIQYLAFDSALFGYPVGKTLLEREWEEDELLRQAGDYQLVYLFSNQQQSFNSPQIKLQDRRIMFEKVLNNPIKPESIQKYQGDLSSELIELAYLSGRYSRFKKDIRLAHQEFEKLYQRWMTTAYERNQLLVSSKLEGMASYSIGNSMASMGLIAVGDRHQRKGWGRQLVEAVEFQVKSEGAGNLQIATQEENLEACSLYQSMGYLPIDNKYIYHYWRG